MQLKGLQIGQSVSKIDLEKFKLHLKRNLLLRKYLIQIVEELIEEDKK